MALLPVAEAQRRLLDSCTPLTASEILPLHDCDGRILAKDVVSKVTQPPFNASAMDGYALRAVDVATVGTELGIIGESAAGHAFGGTVGPGQAVRIFTGAPVPLGADTVLIQEDAEVLSGNRIRTTFDAQLGRHIRPEGQDFKLGDTVLSAGTRLDYSRITLAAATNHGSLEVYRRPRVAILASGDELMSPGGNLGPSQIVASNTYGIAALARACGAEILDLGIARDDLEAIAEAVDRARNAGVDILVTVGGASVGDHDLMQSTLVAQGMTLDFWRIAMRPGKPLMVGSLDGIHVLGLPGNPISSLVCALLFLEPLILKMTHQPDSQRDTIAVTEQNLPANDKRQDYVRATLRRGEDGRFYTQSAGKQDSSLMRTFANSDCLIVRPPHAPELLAGEETKVLLLRPLGS